MRRLAYRADLRIFFGAVLCMMLCIASRVKKNYPELFLKRFLKILESGLEPMREKNGRSGDRTHPGSGNPAATRLRQRGFAAPGSGKNGCSGDRTHAGRRNPVATRLWQRGFAAPGSGNPAATRLWGGSIPAATIFLSLPRLCSKGFATPGADACGPVATIPG